MTDKRIKIDADLSGIEKGFAKIKEDLKDVGKTKVKIPIDNKSIVDSLNQQKQVLFNTQKAMQTLAVKLSNTFDDKAAKRYRDELKGLNKDLLETKRIISSLEKGGLSDGATIGYRGGESQRGGGMMGIGGGLLKGAAAYGIYRMASSIINTTLSTAGERTLLRSLGMSGNGINSIQRSGGAMGFTNSESRMQAAEMMRATGNANQLPGAQALSLMTGIGVGDITGGMGALRQSGMNSEKSLKFLKETFTDAVAAGFDESRAGDVLNIIATNTASMSSNGGVNPQAIKDIMLNLMSNSSFFKDNPNRAMVAMQGLDKGFSSTGPMGGLAFRSLASSFPGMSPIQLEQMRGYGLLGEGGGGLPMAKKFLGQFGSLATSGAITGPGQSMTNDQFAAFSIAIRDAFGFQGNMADEIVKAFMNADDAKLKSSIQGAQQTVEQQMLEKLSNQDLNLKKAEATLGNIREELWYNVGKPLQALSPILIKFAEAATPFFERISGVGHAASSFNPIALATNAYNGFSKTGTFSGAMEAMNPASGFLAKRETWNTLRDPSGRYIGGGGANTLSNSGTTMALSQLGMGASASGILDPRSAQYEAAIQEAAQKYGISPNLMKAYIQHESKFDASAQNRTTDRAYGVTKNGNTKGGAGIAQFIPSTGKSYGLSDMDRLDPLKSIDAMGRYMGDLKQKGMSDQEAIWSIIGGDQAYAGGAPHLKNIMSTKAKLDMADASASSQANDMVSKLMAHIDKAIMGSAAYASPIIDFAGMRKQKAD